MLPTEEEFFAALCERHGEVLQRKFAAASVAVCGLGGLGSNVAIHLARAGVGALQLLDCDFVELTNLNRQQYLPSQIGMEKAKAMRDNIRAIAPYCDVTAQTVRLNARNIPVLLDWCPFICECFDRADQKAMLVNTVLERLPQAYLVAASGMAGLGSANSIQTRQITPHFYLCGDGTSDSSQSGGLFSARVAVCAAHQANAVLRLIANT